MRVGIVILPEHHWRTAAPLWRRAEEYGFDHAWTYDHLGWLSLVDKPWFDPIPTLTAAATVTSRIRLGTLVSSPNYRHPAHFAREITALDDISDGRLIVGLGSGGPGFDTRVLGSRELTSHQRVDRFTEFVELFDDILTHDNTVRHGTYFSAVNARCAPGCVQQPRTPFLIAANGPRAMGVAAKFGQGWVTTGKGGDTPDKWWRGVTGLSQRFTEIAAEAWPSMSRCLQPDNAPIFSLSSVEFFRDLLGRAEELGFTDVITHWPRTDGPYRGREAIVEEIAAHVLPALTNKNLG